MSTVGVDWDSRKEGSFYKKSSESALLFGRDSYLKKRVTRHIYT
jgi:hypothetical protein